MKPGWMALDVETPIGQRQYSFAGLCGRRLVLLSEIMSPLMIIGGREAQAKEVYYLYCWNAEDGSIPEVHIDTGYYCAQCPECLIQVAESLRESHEASAKYLHQVTKEEPDAE
jgi:hypothetical protein